MTDEAIPPDDPSIANTHTVLRRLHPSWMQKDSSGVRHLQSNAFQDMTDPDGVRAMSMFVEERLIALGRSASDLVQQLDGWGVVAVSVEVVRGCGLTLAWAANTLDGIDGQAHVHVFGKKTGSIQKRLVAASKPIVWPPA